MPRLSQQGFILAAGRALEYSYCDHQGGDGPVVVLLHEGLGCCAMWKDFPARLSRRCRLPVLCYSRTGYGRSEGRGLPWPVDYMHHEALEVLPALLAAAALTDVVLVGHSDGASIAAIHAGGRPADGLRGLVLIAPHFFVEEVSLASIAAARAAFETGELRTSLHRYHGVNTEEAFYGWNDAWLDPAFRNWNITPYLPRIAVPVLGLQGRNDEYGTPAQLATLTAKCATCNRTILIDNCGHAPHSDQQDVTLNAIAEFVAQL